MTDCSNLRTLCTVCLTVKIIVSGKVFSEVQILKAIELGDKYKHLPINNFTINSIGVDIGFGSSSTAIVATEYLKKQSKIRVIYSQEWEHGDLRP